jgi:uncharacterized membrane protein YhaH (DUF805 family)
VLATLNIGGGAPALGRWPKGIGRAAMVNLLFSINGRISRGPFWLVYLILFPATLALMLFIEASANNNPVLILIAFVLYSWIAICITVKRLHDMDATGWFSIPIVLILIAVILVGSFPGTVGPNRFGPDPLEGKAMG